MAYPDFQLGLCLRLPPLRRHHMCLLEQCFLIPSIVPARVVM